LANADAATRQIADISTRSEAFRRIGKEWASRGDERNATQCLVEAKDLALQLHRYDKEKRPCLLHAIAETEAQLGLHSNALETVSHIGWNYETQDALVSVAKTEAAAGRLPEAAATANSITPKWRAAAAFAAIAEAQARRRLFAEAKLTTEEVECNPAALTKAEALLTIAKLEAEAGRLDDARETLTMAMRATAKTPQPGHLVEEVDTCSRIARALTELGFERDAVAVSRHLRYPWAAVRAMLAIADVQIRRNAVPNAKTTLLQALAYVENIDETRNKEYLRSGNGRAWWPSRKVDVFKRLGVLFARSGDSDTAHKMFKNALAEIKQYSGRNIAKCVKNDVAEIAQAQADAGFVQDALESVKILQAVDMTVEAAAIISSSKASPSDIIAGRRPSPAEALANALRSGETRDLADTLCAVAEAQARIGSNDIAKATFTRALETRIADGTARMSAHQAIVDAQIRSGCVSDAIDAMKALQCDRAKTTAMIAIIKSYDTNNHPSDMRTLFTSLSNESAFVKAWFSITAAWLGVSQKLSENGKRGEFPTVFWTIPP